MNIRVTHFLHNRTSRRLSYNYISPMRGSLHRRSKPRATPAVWTLRAEGPRDPEHPTRRNQKTTTLEGTYDQAVEALGRFVETVKAGTPGDGQMTFNELFEKWQEDES